ncbi:hypothetical protein HK407_12g17920 [Ordospora pajunii]|uniref:uncharacterized protein n=1 Tax=Ordospora pajunii TaxID=3039483 RepID=UPI0029528E0A|nr:uncharacterized protein HK407_12g17920 [Ordospora pajunii]KAH9410660.1 hypothetical protein HK407_12g17920 [Ordospora pajunii]
MLLADYTRNQRIELSKNDSKKKVNADEDEKDEVEPSKKSWLSSTGPWIASTVVMLLFLAVIAMIVINLGMNKIVYGDESNAKKYMHDQFKELVDGNLKKTESVASKYNEMIDKVFEEKVNV